MYPQTYNEINNDDEFLMPLKIINQIENMYDSRKNQDKILELTNKHGTDICNTSEHREYFESLEWKHMGNDDEYENHESCLGCGGIIEQ